MTNAEAAAPEFDEVSEVLNNLEPVSLVSELQAMNVEIPVLTAPNVNENLLVKGTGNVGTSAARGCGRSNYKRKSSCRSNNAQRL